MTRMFEAARFQGKQSPKVEAVVDGLRAVVDQVNCAKGVASEANNAILVDKEAKANVKARKKAEAKARRARDMAIMKAMRESRTIKATNEAMNEAAKAVADYKLMAAMRKGAQVHRKGTQTEAIMTEAKSGVLGAWANSLEEKLS